MFKKLFDWIKEKIKIFGVPSSSIQIPFEKKEISLSVDQFVKSLIERKIIKENGSATIAVRTWKTSKGSAFETVGPNETRYLVNQDAFTNQSSEVKNKIPQSFLEQIEWEAKLMPGKLYRPRNTITIRKDWVNDAWDDERGRDVVLTPDSILLLVQVGNFIGDRRDDGSFEIKQVAEDSESVQMTIQLPKMRHYVAYRQELEFGMATHSTSNNGRFAQHERKPDFYRPIIVQKWICGERVIEYSFISSELEEVKNEER